MSDRAGAGDTSPPSSSVRSLRAVLRDGANKPEPDEIEQFSDFFKANFSGLVKLVHLLGAPYSVAGDYVQEAMIKALPPRWMELDNPRAWCRRVAVRNYLRDAARCKEKLVGEFETADNSVIGCESEVVERAEQVEVMRLLRQLPLRQRQVAACVFDGMTHPEIGEALDITAGTSRATWWQAKQQLARLLRTDGGPR